MQHIHAEFGFEIGFVPSGNLSMTLVVDKSKEDISDCMGLRGVAMATKFWPK